MWIPAGCRRTVTARAKTWWSNGSARRSHQYCRRPIGGRRPDQVRGCQFTPRWEKKFGFDDSNYDAMRQLIESQLKGKRVKFSGWMLYDFIHENAAQSTRPNQPVCANFGDKNCNWRATPWEVHPVTAYEIVTDRDAISFQLPTPGETTSIPVQSKFNSTEPLVTFLNSRDLKYCPTAVRLGSLLPKRYQSRTCEGH